MLPEAYLGSEEEDEKIRKIQSTMKNYADDHPVSYTHLIQFNQKMEKKRWMNIQELS